MQNSQSALSSLRFQSPRSSPQEETRIWWQRVAYRVTIKGTHMGRPYMGIAASGKKIEMKNTSIKRIANGKLAESWGTLDSLSAMRQLGLIPAR